jgi:PAS domain S-box-containing protein
LPGPSLALVYRKPGRRASRIDHREPKKRVVSANETAVSAEAYRLLFEHGREMACTLDLRGRFTAVNRAGERLTGFSEQELLGRFALDLIAPELRQQAARQFQERLLTDGDRRPDPTVLVRRDGQRVAIEVTSTMIRRDGDVVGVLGLIADVSER